MMFIQIIKMVKYEEMYTSFLKLQIYLLFL